jgi:hypothetical protein
VKILVESGVDNLGQRAMGLSLTVTRLSLATWVATLAMKVGSLILLCR